MDPTAWSQTFSIIFVKPGVGSVGSKEQVVNTTLAYYEISKDIYAFTYLENKN